MLPWFQPSTARHLFAEAEESANLVTQFGQRLVVMCFDVHSGSTAALSISDAVSCHDIKTCYLLVVPAPRSLLCRNATLFGQHFHRAFPAGATRVLLPASAVHHLESLVFTFQEEP